jgi:hypothetical protein
MPLVHSTPSAIASSILHTNDIVPFVDACTWVSWIGVGIRTQTNSLVSTSQASAAPAAFVDTCNAYPCCKSSQPIYGFARRRIVFRGRRILHTVVLHGLVKLPDFFLQLRSFRVRQGVLRLTAGKIVEKIIPWRFTLTRTTDKVRHTRVV